MWDANLLRKHGIEQINGYYKLKKSRLGSDYYKKRYFDDSKGAEAIFPYKQMTEIEWYRKWVEAYAILIKKYVKKRKNVKLLDVGCGGGVWLKLFDEIDFINAEGIEPYEHFKEIWKLIGTNKYIHKMTLEGFLETTDKKYDVVFLGNILEHVEKPESFVKSIRDKLLEKKGLILCKVPNDFSILQYIGFKKKLVDKMYWVGKEHINYFAPESLKKFFEKLNFSVLDMITGYPLEIFILMGMNYIDNPELGKVIHGLRMNFDIQMPTENLISFYRGLINMGMGRDITIFCRKI